MIWSKTDAGRVEMQSRALVKERTQRNLLLLIDGVKSQEMLLGSIAGVSKADFDALAALGLIAPVGGSASSGSKAAAPAPAAAAAAPAEPTDYANFTQTLTQLISSELGLRGFTLTLAVEKAGTPDELRDVGERVLKQILERKGEDAADKARRKLYGG
ncbi:hypothetical protein [Piscinibacter gummiphilus]|uniref:Uncharacterized protein n=1 Tax=Piscinibacter gummiphilus TaxID=946333 RepID=A0A1W6L3E2_9BURK|nr:hypothetical protein [Piscinibacter gummiphilus]ARN18811.1 hypothetical protein A4W93_02105 [Piscinibacter gummiphilus]ATU63455.1 hypothetical protein CPZ87_02175 [Piscinibacter gummiphilus]GLS95969.1 hypothetical protein GCM10007918_32610 [Piscinibacter gummiphilus]